MALDLVIRRRLALSLFLLIFAPPSLLAQTAVVNGHTVTLVSTTPSGTAGNGDSYAGAASTAPGGPCVAFASLASDLVAGDTNGVADVFLREAGATARVSVASEGLPANDHSDFWSGVSVTAGCRRVAFGSRATNLVPGDTNGLQDVFVHDRESGTTMRVVNSANDGGALRDAGSPSVSEAGLVLAFDTAVNPLLSGSRVYVYDGRVFTVRPLPAPGGADARRPATSGDGRFVAFATYGRGSVPGLVYDDRLWLHDLSSGATRELAVLGNSSDDFDLAGRPNISHDGRFVAFASSRPLLPADTNRDYDVYLQNTQTGERVLLSAGPDGRAVGGLGPVLSRDGRFVAFSSSSRALLPADGSTDGLFVFDAVTRRIDLVVSTTAAWVVPSAFTPDARHLTVSTTANWAGNDTRAGSVDTYLVSLDSDDDEVPDTWEALFGMNPYAADSTGDADEDGLTNLQEYVDGTHPRGLFRRLLAEGATGMFATRLAIANPDADPVMAVVSLLPASLSGASPVRRSVQVGGRSSALLDVGAIPGMESAEFSIAVESSRPLAVERLMTWDARSYGGHTETAMGEPAAEWHFAEGATHSGFDLFYLLQNTGDAIADVHVRYLLPSPAAPFARTYRLPPHSRQTIWVNHEDSRLSATDVSAHITSNQPIVAERAMYLGRQGLLYAAGHAAAAVRAPSTSWTIAEGATGPFFDLFVLLSNPGDTPADVRLRFLLPDGRTVDRDHRVAPQSRTTVWVDYEAPELSETAVATLVTSLNDVPVVAERAMWWPGPTPANWLEAHAATASNTTAQRWLLPASAVLTSGANSFLLLANPGEMQASADVTLFFDTGTTASRRWMLPARSRTNVWVNVDFPSTRQTLATVLVESDAPIVVERADYWQAEGVPWEGGTATRATPLPAVIDGEETFVLATGASRRASFDELAPGTHTLPLLLDGGDVRVALTQAATVTVRPPDHTFTLFTTNHLAARVSDFGSNIVVGFPEGTTAAGLWLAGEAAVTATATDVEGGGATRRYERLTPAGRFVGFHGGPGIRAIRVSVPAGADWWDVYLGDIVYARR